MKLHYTEKDYGFELRSGAGFCLDLIMMLIVAPFRLCNEISLKVVYLKRQDLERLILGACLVTVGFVVATFVGMRAEKSVGLWVSRFPWSVQFVVLAVLGILFLFVHSYNFQLWQQTEFIAQFKKQKQGTKGSVKRWASEVTSGQELFSQDEQEDEIPDFDAEEWVDEESETDETSTAQTSKIAQNFDNKVKEEEENTKDSAPTQVPTAVTWEKERERNLMEPDLTVLVQKGNRLYSNEDLSRLEEEMKKSVESNRYVPVNLVKALLGYSCVDSFGVEELLGVNLFPAEYNLYE